MVNPVYQHRLAFGFLLFAMRIVVDVVLLGQPLVWIEKGARFHS